MLLSLASWPEVEVYLKHSDGIVIPIGSHEQHGPNGLTGTDALCPEIIAHAAAAEAGFLVAPTFSVGQAQHHLGFPGTISLRPSTMIAALLDWIASLRRAGFRRFYFLNGHGGNIATIQAAFSEAYFPFSTAGEPAPFMCTLRNWWELKGVDRLSRQLYPTGLGSHATPAEVAVTYFGYPHAEKCVAIPTKATPDGPIRDAGDYRARFPDGRIGSDPTQATIDGGRQLVEASKAAMIVEVEKFFEEPFPALQKLSQRTAAE